MTISSFEISNERPARLPNGESAQVIGEAKASGSADAVRSATGHGWL